jgi:hypothetical protein
MRALRVTRKRIVVRLSTLEDLLVGFHRDHLEALASILEYLQELAERGKGKASQSFLDDAEDAFTLLHRLFADLDMDYVRRPYKNRVIVNEKTGTLTIVRMSDDVGGDPETEPESTTIDQDRLDVVIVDASTDRNARN